MDGFSVNWVFLDALENDSKEEDPNAPSLLNIGTCVLHVLHGAYKTVHSKVDWDIDKTLNIHLQEEQIILQITILLINIMIKQ